MSNDETIEQAKNSVRLEGVIKDVCSQEKKVDAMATDISDIKLKLNEIMFTQKMYAGLIVGGLSLVISIVGILLKMP